MWAGRLECLAAGLEHADVVVDAIFGTGFKGSPRDDAADVIARLNGHRKVVSADIPSGVDGASGRVQGVAVRAAVTVAIGAQKIGTALPPGSDHSGSVEVVDVGIPLGATADEGPAVMAVGAEDVAAPAGPGPRGRTR